MLLENHEPAVLSKMAVEGDRLLDPEPLHNDEAEGVAEREALVAIGSKECERLRFVSLANAFDAASGALDRLQELEGECSSVARPSEQKRVRLVNNSIGRHELPALTFTKLEEGACSDVRSIFDCREGEEATGVDEDALHSSRVSP